MSQAKEMQDLIRHRKGSGLAQRAFAEQEGVSYSAFQWWRRRVLQSGRGARPPVGAAPVDLARRCRPSRTGACARRTRRPRLLLPRHRGCSAWPN